MLPSTNTRIYVDGATGAPQWCGIAAIARQPDGRFLGWASRRLPTMTNNEAEYQAILLGLELARRLGLSHITLISDSEVVVWQMRGRSRVISPRLRALHRQACAAARYFAVVAFEHVLRSQNELADALAAEALQGRELALPAARWRWPLRRRRAPGAANLE